MDDDHAFLNGKRFYKKDLEQLRRKLEIPEEAEVLFLVNPNASKKGEYNDYLIFISDDEYYAAIRPCRYDFTDPSNNSIWKANANILGIAPNAPENLRIELAKTQHKRHYHNWRRLEVETKRKLL